MKRMHFLLLSLWLKTASLRINPLLPFSFAVTNVKSHFIFSVTKFYNYHQVCWGTVPATSEISVITSCCLACRAGTSRQSRAPCRRASWAGARTAPLSSSSPTEIQPTVNSHYLYTLKFKPVWWIRLSIFFPGSGISIVCFGSGSRQKWNKKNYK